MARDSKNEEIRQMVRDAHAQAAEDAPPPKPTWSPQQGSQFAYFECPAFELLYGGAAGGGKTENLVMEAAHLCSTYDGYRAILFRRTFPEIEKSLVPRVTDLLYGENRSRDQGMEWHFPNGSVLYLSHLQKEEDKERYKSSEFDWIGFDELTSFTETQYVYMFTRCRGKRPVPRYVRAGSNPTGPGHSWVKKRFVNFDVGDDGQPLDVTPYQAVMFDFAYGWRVKGQTYTTFEELPDNYQKGEPVFSEREYIIYKEKKSGLTRAFLPSLLWGNAALLKNDPDYVKRMQAVDHKQQQGLLYGSWDMFEGQFFGEWNPDIHVVEPRVIPPSWRRYVAIDYGYTSPMCALWFAVDEDGIIWVYRELYGKNMTTFEQAARVVEMTEEDEKIEWYAADPALFAHSGAGESHAMIYDRAGVSLIASSNRRGPGWALLHEVLRDGGIKFFRTCVNTIRTLPSLTHSPHNPEDVNTKQEDHAADVLRYFLLTWRGFKSPALKQADGGGTPAWFAEQMRKNNPIRKRTTRVRL
jgi:hypothetical protein